MVLSVSKKGAGKKKAKSGAKPIKKTAKKIVKKVKSKKKKTLRLIPKKSAIKKMKKPVRLAKPVAKSAPKIDRTKKLGTFIYMGLYGRGEAVRMLLYHAKILYDMVIVTREQITTMRAKGQLPAGQVPVWVTPEKRVLN